MNKIKFINLCLALSMVFCLPGIANANTQSFSNWLQDVRMEAKQKGISNRIIKTALHNGLKPIPRIIELDRKQPEGKMTYKEYRRKSLNSNRIETGRKMMRKHSNKLAKVRAEYGVNPRFIVALWGMETSYGGYTGGFDIVNALATLAYDGRRSKFFRTELFHALKILDQGHIEYKDMKGSWAGAMGQSQFMPSSFLSYAVDFNKDGKKDIWNTKDDVFASASNYLISRGWKTDETWGRRVFLPKGFNEKKWISLDIEKPLSFWNKMGIKTVTGKNIPALNMMGSLVQPDGIGTDTYLVYNNYKVIMKWNKSTYFATTIGLLADSLAVY